MGKKSTLDTLHPEAKKMAEELTRFVPIKIVLSAGVAALYDLPPQERERYFTKMSKIDNKEVIKIKLCDFYDFFIENTDQIKQSCPSEFRRLVEFFAALFANEIDAAASDAVATRKQIQLHSRAKSG